MKKVYLRGPYDLVTEEVPIPFPEHDQVVIRVKACGVCATDVHSFAGESIQGKRFPFHPGHEVSGVVHNVGSKVRHLNVGDHVVVDPLYPCESCDFCRQNKQNHCVSVRTLGVVGPGGFSDYVVVPAKNAYVFSNDDFMSATFAEPLSTVLYGLERAEVSYGDRVLITGAGPIGLLHLQMLKHSGVSQVVVTDLVSEKLDIAQRFGADTLLISDSSSYKRLKNMTEYGFDIVIDCTGVPAVVEQSISFVKNTGRLLIFGVAPRDGRITISPFEVYRRDIKIIGSYALNRTMKSALRLLEAGMVETEGLVALVIDRTRLVEAFELIKTGKVNGKIIVKHQD